MSDVKETKEIPQEVIDYSKKLQKELKVEHIAGKDEATLILEDKKFFVNNLEGDLTEASYKAHEKHKKLAAAGIALATGEMGLAYMKKHPHIEKVSTEVPVVGGDKLKATLLRTKMVSSFGTEPVEKLGHITAGYEMRGTKGSVGDLSAVRQHIYSLGAESLSKKK